MFGKLKRIFRKKDDDFDVDFRSHVVGDTFKPSPVSEPMPSNDYDLSGPKEKPERPFLKREPIKMNDPELRSSFDENYDDFSQAAATRQSGNNNYELNDRLGIIEAQLSAIRSQTETINERLKNLEMKLTRRY